MRTYQAFTARCKTCGAVFELLDEGQAYDMRMLRSRKSNVHAKVMCDSDGVFNEVWGIVKGLLSGSQLAEIERSERFSAVFGAICDPASDGSEFDMTGRPFCPACGERNISFGPTQPPAFRSADIPDVSHRAWDRLSDEEKRKRVEALLVRK